jgi:hypothetical protein
VVNVGVLRDENARHHDANPRAISESESANASGGGSGAEIELIRDEPKGEEGRKIAESIYPLTRQSKSKLSFSAHIVDSLDPFLISTHVRVSVSHLYIYIRIF